MMDKISHTIFVYTFVFFMIFATGCSSHNWPENVIQESQWGKECLWLDAQENFPDLYICSGKIVRVDEFWIKPDNFYRCGAETHYLIDGIGFLPDGRVGELTIPLPMDFINAESYYYATYKTLHSYPGKDYDHIRPLFLLDLTAMKAQIRRIARVALYDMKTRKIESLWDAPYIQKRLKEYNNKNIALPKHTPVD